MGAALAAVAGLMVTLYYGVVDFFIGFLAGVKAFTAAVLGGIGSLPGAMLGGLLIGLIEAFWSGYFSVEYKDVSVFAILDPGAGVHADRAARPARGGKGLMAVAPAPPAAPLATGDCPPGAGSNGLICSRTPARGGGRRLAGVCRLSVSKPTTSAAARSACARISTGSRSLVAAVFAGRFAVQLFPTAPLSRRAGQRPARWLGSPPGAAAAPSRSR